MQVIHATPLFSALQLEWIGKEQWMLTADFLYLHDDGPIRVPQGFVTDLDSVPRIPGAYAWLKGRAQRAAVVHDYLYETQAGRAKADRIFLDAMKHAGVPRRRRWPIYLAVRAGGWLAYRNHGRP